MGFLEELIEFILRIFFGNRETPSFGGGDVIIVGNVQQVSIFSEIKALVESLLKISENWFEIFQVCLGVYAIFLGYKFLREGPEGLRKYLPQISFEHDKVRISYPLFHFSNEKIEALVSLFSVTDMYGKKGFGAGITISSPPVLSVCLSSRFFHPQVVERLQVKVELGFIDKIGDLVNKSVDFIPPRDSVLLLKHIKID
jgi:hypothetical protein